MYKLITLIEVYDTFHTIAPSKFKYLLTKIFFSYKRAIGGC